MKLIVKDKDGNVLRARRKDRHIRIKVAYIADLPQEKQTQLRGIFCEIERKHGSLT